MASRNQRYDRGDFMGRPPYQTSQRQSPGEPAIPTEPPTESDRLVEGPYMGDRLVAADYLSTLGWSGEEIARLFDGARASSIHEILLPVVIGRAVFPSPLGPFDPQPAIVDAVWKALHGEPSPLVVQASRLASMPSELQAYFLAVLQAGFGAQKTALEDWYVQFDRRSSAAGRALATAVSVGLQAVQQAGLPTVLKEAVGDAIRISTGFQEAFHAEGTPQPILHMPRWPVAKEGADVFRGLSLIAAPSSGARRTGARFGRLRKLITEDRVASRLPIVHAGEEYPLWVSIRQFRQAAAKLGLYR